MQKICAECKIPKNIEEFGKDKYNKDGLNYDCKLCKNKKARIRNKVNPQQTKARSKRNASTRAAWYKTKPGIESSRRAHLKRKYNITLEDYNKLLDKQNSVCAICGRTEMNNANKVLCVDHNHNTGAIRGLLCGLCNSGIGHFQDDIILIRKSISYLKQYKK